MSSWPGQKGHSSSLDRAMRSTLKSFGRLRRSVEMATQRPVTGSRLSSGIECVLEDLYGRALIVEMNGDDVEAARAIVQPVPRDEVHRELHDPPALERRHRFTRRAKRAGIARLHLDEDQ